MFNFKNISFKIFNPKNKVNMNYENVSKIVGREINAENFHTITAEEFAKINANVPAPQSPEATTAEQTAETTAATTATTSAETSAETTEATANEAQQGVSAAEMQQLLNNALAPISERLTALEKQPGATATATPTVTGEEKQATNAWDDPNNPINQELDRRLGGN